MARQKHNAPPDLFLGQMPVKKIYEALGLEIDDGDIVFSSAAQMHASRRHPKDFPICLPFAGGVATNPLYLGDDARNDGKIECISRVPAMGQAVLVALTIEPDGNGRYHVASIYPVSYKKIEARLKSGHLKRCK